MATLRENVFLYLVPTPIGNLDDITIRSIKVLQEVDLILAEDTRTSGVLLKHHGIQNKLQSYHIHNEHGIVEFLVEKIKAGQKMALITDAGTPGISDPGFLLVRECVKNDIQLECLPGATAFVPALVKSGIPTDSFVFEGFLPQKKGRQTAFKRLAEETRTMVIYESPYRLVKTLEDIADYMGKDRVVSVSREISKLHEETKNGFVEDVLKYYKDKGVKGEIVIVISGKS
jgi:16S rRNA (cytidine1402-2'-O)-methyltransferase